MCVLERAWFLHNPGSGAKLYKLQIVTDFVRSSWRSVHVQKTPITRRSAKTVDATTVFINSMAISDSLKLSIQEDDSEETCIRS